MRSLGETLQRAAVALALLVMGACLGIGLFATDPHLNFEGLFTFVWIGIFALPYCAYMLLRKPEA